MAVHLRLRRIGAKKRPFYRIVAADERRARNGAFLEILGTYNPIEKPAVIQLHEAKVQEWLNLGATPSDTVRTLLAQIGFMKKYTDGKLGRPSENQTLRTTITERKKKTRKMKKAELAESGTAG